YSDDDSEDEYHDEDEEEELADQELPEEVEFQDEEDLNYDAEEDPSFTRNKRKLISRQKGRKKQKQNGQTPPKRKKRNQVMSDSDDEYQEASLNVRQRGNERRNTRSKRGQATSVDESEIQDFEFDSVNPHTGNDDLNESTPRRPRRGRAFVVDDED
ncbi:hypothetical protein K7432_010978, partial [Basidiobolus ranarum]